MDHAALDKLIERLMSPTSPFSFPSPKSSVCDIFFQQPNLPELEAPIKICGTLSSPRSSLFFWVFQMLSVFIFVVEIFIFVNGLV